MKKPKAKKSMPGKKAKSATGAKAKPSKKAAAKPKPKAAPKKPAKVLPVPKGYHTVQSYLVVKGASAAIDFYRKAFGAVEQFRMGGPDGRVMHAEIRIGDSIVMLSDEMPEMGNKGPLSYGGTPASLFLYVKDVDALFKQAEAAGAKIVMPLTNMFWGDRFGKMKDPFGHEWAAATHIEDVKPEEMERRMREMPPPPIPPA